jgi:hypothetical protein
LGPSNKWGIELPKLIFPFSIFAVSLLQFHFPYSLFLSVADPDS